MRILVSNDDGIYSPGIACLARVAQRFGEVRVVAPDVEQSSASHAVTSSRPLTYRPTPQLGDVEAYRVNGTPADCVALGVYNWKDVDLVLSGINLGVNMGNGIWHSGTLAAAKQATLFGIRGIAFSTPVRPTEPDFTAMEPHVERVLDTLLTDDTARLVNVNVPPSPKGIAWTRQAVRHYDGKVVPDEDPMGRQLFWFTVVPIEETEQGTDLWAFSRGYITMTPLTLDLTEHAELERLRAAMPIDEPAPEEATTEPEAEDEQP
jgi:5'-nucleotidase